MTDERDAPAWLTALDALDPLDAGGRPAGYVLEGHTPRPVGVGEFVRWWAAHPGPKRAVAQTTLADGRWLSTVFLGHDHNLRDTGPPILFETMLFASEDDLTESYCRRYVTWDEAAAGHAAVLKRLREGQPAEPVGDDGDEEG